MFNQICSQLSQYTPSTRWPYPGASPCYFPASSPLSRHAPSSYHSYEPRSKLGRLNERIEQESVRRHRIQARARRRSGYYSDTQRSLYRFEDSDGWEQRRRTHFDATKPVLLLDNEVKSCVKRQQPPVPQPPVPQLPVPQLPVPQPLPQPASFLASPVAVPTVVVQRPTLVGPPAAIRYKVLPQPRKAPPPKSKTYTPGDKSGSQSSSSLRASRVEPGPPTLAEKDSIIERLPEFNRKSSGEDIKVEAVGREAVGREAPSAQASNLSRDYFDAVDRRVLDYATSLPPPQPPAQLPAKAVPLDRQMKIVRLLNGVLVLSALLLMVYEIIR